MRRGRTWRDDDGSSSLAARSLLGDAGLVAVPPGDGDPIARGGTTLEDVAQALDRPLPALALEMSAEAEGLDQLVDRVRRLGPVGDPDQDHPGLARLGLPDRVVHDPVGAATETALLDPGRRAQLDDRRVLPGRAQRRLDPEARPGPHPAGVDPRQVESGEEVIGEAGPAAEVGEELESRLAGGFDLDLGNDGTHRDGILLVRGRRSRAAPPQGRRLCVRAQRRRAPNVGSFLVNAVPNPIDPPPDRSEPPISLAAERARAQLREEIERVRSGVEEMLSEQSAAGAEDEALRRELDALREDTRLYVKKRAKRTERKLDRRIDGVEERTDRLAARIDQVEADRAAAEVRIHTATEQMLDGLLAELRAIAELLTRRPGR